MTMRWNMKHAVPFAPALVIGLVLAPLLGGCASAPSQSPSEMGPSILSALDAGEEKEANDLFRSVARDRSYTEAIYPVLYKAARGRYEEGDTAASSRVLRFMRRHYEDAAAVREALLYSLFIERGRSDDLDPELTEEMDAVMAELSELNDDSPVWLDLVAAQQAIDRGELGEARAALERFRSAWTGEPAELALYVDEMDQYIQIHATQP